MAKVKFTIADVQRAVKAARLAGIGDRLTVSIMPTGEIKISPFIEEPVEKTKINTRLGAQDKL